MPKGRETQQIQLSLTLGEIYKVLCPECREKLLTLAAQSGAVETFKKQLKEQWEASDA